MRIRTPLLSCVALVLVTTTGFGQVSLYGNCPYRDSNGDWWCHAWMYGDVNLPGDRSVYNLLVIDKRDTGTLTNIGSIAYNVVIEQGIRWGPAVKVNPGKTINIGPLDNNFLSWGRWAPVISVSRDAAPPETKYGVYIAKIHITEGCHSLIC